MFDFSGGVAQQENGLGTANMFASKDPASQGQYNPLELLQMLMKKKQKQQPIAMQGQSMTPFQRPMQAQEQFPNYMQGIVPQQSPNGQIMPNYGLLG